LNCNGFNVLNANTNNALPRAGRAVNPSGNRPALGHPSLEAVQLRQTDAFTDLAKSRVKPGIRNFNCIGGGGNYTKSDQSRQTFNPELDVATQLGREILRPQLAGSERPLTCVLVFKSVESSMNNIELKS